MPPTAPTALTVLAAAGCGTVGGVFFAFSTFVMHGLGRVPPATGAAAMQGINLSAVRPVFMAALFGTGVACAVLVVRGIQGWGVGPSGLLVAAGLLYVVGTLGVTIAGNVPLNNALAALAPDAAAATGLWSHYRTRWGWWNHLRTASSLGASLLFGIALTYR